MDRENNDMDMDDNVAQQEYNNIKCYTLIFIYY